MMTDVTVYTLHCETVLDYEKYYVTCSFTALLFILVFTLSICSYRTINSL